MIPDEVALPVLVRQLTNLALTKVAVLVNCDRAGKMYVKSHPNKDRQRSALVAREIAGIVPQEPFYVRLSNFSKVETHLPKGMTLAYKRHTETWLTTAKDD